MTPQQQAAMWQALEALELGCPTFASLVRTGIDDKRDAAITALRQALEQQPADDEPVANASAWFALVMNAAAELEDASHCLRDEDAKRTAISGAKHYRDAAKALYTRPQPAAPEFYHHVVKNEGDWSEWVNPDNDSYMMKCCDCGLVHEMQFKVAKYSEGDECEFVNDPDLQPVFRARRAEEAWQEKDMAHRAGGLPQPAAWVGLTDEEIHDIYDQVAKQEPYSGAVTRRNVARAIEAKLREKNAA